MQVHIPAIDRVMVQSVFGASGSVKEDRYGLQLADICVLLLLNTVIPVVILSLVFLPMEYDG